MHRGSAGQGPPGVDRSGVTAGSPSFPARVTVSSVLLADRLYTEIEKPFSATFRARF